MQLTGENLMHWTLSFPFKVEDILLGADKSSLWHHTRRIPCFQIEYTALSSNGPTAQATRIQSLGLVKIQFYNNSLE